DGILAYHIIDVRHRPGTSNTAADGLSRSFSTTEPTALDGGTWTVSEDWEATRGIVQDLLAVNVSTTEQNVLTDSTEITNLLQRFNNEPFFVDIIQALVDLDQDKPIRDKRRARHRANNFFLAEGKLWRVANSSANRAHSRLECVTREEARDIAYQEHMENGHWGRNLVKLRLMDKILCPRLDRIITDAI
ncbi:hypothetical protein P692DRAFT_201659651, partial [Suillus brevipes Sb2]